MSRRKNRKIDRIFPRSTISGFFIFHHAVRECSAMAVASVSIDRVEYSYSMPMDESLQAEKINTPMAYEVTPKS